MSDLQPMPEAAPCRFCGSAAFTAGVDGHAHACCQAWAAVIAAGSPCPSCGAARWLEGRRSRGAQLPPLPRFLPDGRPFAPGAGAAPLRPAEVSAWSCVCGAAGTAPGPDAAKSAHTAHWVRDCPRPPYAAPAVKQPAQPVQREMEAAA